MHESVRNGFFISLLEILKLLFKAGLYVRSKLRPDLRVDSKQHKTPRCNYYWRRHYWFLKGFAVSVFPV